MCSCWCVLRVMRVRACGCVRVCVLACMHTSTHVPCKGLSCTSMCTCMRTCKCFPARAVCASCVRGCTTHMANTLPLRGGSGCCCCRYWLHESICVCYMLYKVVARTSELICHLDQPRGSTTTESRTSPVVRYVPNLIGEASGGLALSLPLSLSFPWLGSRSFPWLGSRSCSYF